MKKTLVMTIIGADRPGLVDELAAAVAGHDGNWLESRMAHLAGQFAGLLQVEVSEDRAGALEQALGGLEGLQVVLAESGDEVGPAEPGMILEVVGQDRPGIVSEISRAIAGCGMNVEELTTGCESAPMTGEILFRAKARITAPPGAGAGAAAEALRKDLERIAADLMVDVEMHDA